MLNFGTDCNLIAVFLLCDEMIVFIFGMQEYLSSSVWRLMILCNRLFFGKCLSTIFRNLLPRVVFTL